MRESVDVFLKAQAFRPPRFAQRLLGNSFSGDVIQPAKLAVTTFRELESISAGIVEAIRNVAERVAMAPYQNLAGDLVALFDSEFDACAAGMRECLAQNFKRLSDHPTVSARFDSELANVQQARHVELRVYAASIPDRDARDAPRILYNSNDESAGLVDLDSS